MSTTNRTKIPGIRPASLGARSALPERATSPPNRLSTPPAGPSRLPRRLQTHKPLPSPPIAQVVNPNSPPKAHRTLIDAYSASPIGPDWPIIRPENVPPRLSSKRSSLPTSSNITSTAPLSLEEEVEEPSTRVKRLSWHSFSTGASSGTGPILRISTDADAVIYGSRDSVPGVPIIPTVLPKPIYQPRSFSSRASRMTKATESRTSLSIIPPSPTRSTSESMSNLSPCVKISPIRSMQPPRKASLDGHARKSPSPLATSFVDVMTTGQGAGTAANTHLSTPKSSHDISESTTPDSEPKSIALNLTVVPEMSEQTAEAHQDHAELSPEPAITPKDDYTLEVKKIRTTVTPSKNATIPCVPDAHASMDSPFLDIRNADRSSPFSPHTPPSRSHDTVRDIDPHKLRVPEAAVSISVDSSLGRHTPNGRQSDQSGRQSHASPVTTSSLLHGEPPDKQDRSSSKKVMAQRSLRGIFSRDKSHAKTPETVTTKHGFMSATRSSLAKVMRDSKSRSKVHLAKVTESKPETGPDHTMEKKHSPPMPLTAFKFAGTTASPSRQFVPDNREKTCTVVLDMLDRVDGQPRDSPDRLRDVQIAEVRKTLSIRVSVLQELLLIMRYKQCVVNAAESSRNANICAMEAKKNSRDAEIHADRAGLELMRVYGLLADAGLDSEAGKAIASHDRTIGLARASEAQKSTVSDGHPTC
ncbi:hypothetical protein DDE82_008266 [Stemphylium lycopersici]|nr:hypothetical protein DDE82_008266 [Stemphylium lycopersici]